MKIALAVGATREEAQFAAQVGARHAVIGGPDSPRGLVEYDALLKIQDLFAEFGLEVCAIENVPIHFYDQVMFGLPGRDAQLDHYCATIRNMSRAGIPILGYNWMLLGGLSTDVVRGRGGARERRFEWDAALRNRAAAFDWRNPLGTIHLPDRDLSSEEVWENLTVFLQRVVPVAEEYGVKLAAHPDDAPIPSFLGVARILHDLDALQRVVDTVPSPCNGLDFCQGTISEMTGVNVIDAIHHFGRQGKIVFAHYRAVRGQVPRFDEVFMDEGDTDMFAAMRAYKEVGFDGPMRADHTPGVVGDNAYAHRGFAFEIGYMRAMAQAADLAAAAQAKGGR
jgi:mannonate dehydratase